MKHIVLIAPYPYRGEKISGGVERVVDTLMREFSKIARVTLIAPGSPGQSERMIAGVRIIHLAKSIVPGALAYWSLDAFKIRRLVEKLDADVVHIQGAAGYGVFLKQPYFVTVHGIAHLDAEYFNSSSLSARFTKQLKSNIISIVERAGRARAKGIVLINEYVAQALPDVALRKTAFIANPVDPFFTKAQIHDSSREAFRLLSVGKICRRKNIIGLLQMFVDIARLHPQARIALCGATPDQDYLETCKAFALTNNIENSVEWLGALGSEELLQQYDRASLLVTLSSQETAPMAIAEAHVRGLPVAAPPDFGVKHMIRDGINGVLLTCPTKFGLQASKALAQRFDHEKIAADARSEYDVAHISRDTLAYYNSAD